MSREALVLEPLRLLAIDSQRVFALHNLLEWLR